MNRAPFSLLLPLLAVAACQTDKMPLKGFFRPPDGSILLKGGGTLEIVIAQMSDQPPQTFRVRVNGMDAIVATASGTPTGEDIYDYVSFQVPWGGTEIAQIELPAGTYVVELVDEAGRSWAMSEPLALHDTPPPTGGVPTDMAVVMFVHYGAKMGAWTVDPTTQDADPATSEITVTNVTDGDVAVDRCLGATNGRTCSPAGTVAPGADLHTVETITVTTTPTYPITGTESALVIHPAASATPSLERPLVHMGALPGSCAVERIIVHGARELTLSGARSVTSFALSSCFNSY